MADRKKSLSGYEWLSGWCGLVVVVEVVLRWYYYYYYYFYFYFYNYCHLQEMIP